MFPFLPLRIQQLIKSSFARASFSILILQISLAGFTYLLGIVLARYLGPEGLGVYDFSDAWIEILTLASVMGFDRLLIRQLPSYHHFKQWDLWLGIQNFAKRFSFLLSLLLATLFIAFIGFVFRQAPLTFSGDSLPKIIANPTNQLIILTCFAAAILLPIRTRILIQQGILHGMGQVTKGLVPDYLFRIGGLLVLLVIAGFLFHIELTPYTAMLLHVIAALSALAFGTILLRQQKPTDIPSSTPHYLPRDWITTNLGFVTNSVSVLLTSRISIILLGTFSTLEQTSFYSISLRIAAILALIQAAINTMLQPRIARLYAENDIDNLQALVTLGVRSISLLAFPIAFVLIIFGSFILGIFGEEFVTAYPLLLILCIGQMINVFSGLHGTVLAMTGYERVQAKFSVFVMIATAILSFVLIPTMGGLGAAIATALGLTLRNLIFTALVYYHLKIWTLPITWKRSNA